MPIFLPVDRPCGPADSASSWRSLSTWPARPAPASDPLSRSEFASDQQMIERKRGAAVVEEIERADRPHQRVFEPGLVPEIAADPPALDVRDDEENEDRQRD